MTFRLETERTFPREILGNDFEFLLGRRVALWRHSHYDVATMQRVGVRRLRDGLSRYIKRVARGERIVVTDHDKDVASLEPILQSDEDRFLLELVRDGQAEWSGGKPTGAKKPARVKGPSVADAVIEDRE